MQRFYPEELIEEIRVNNDILDVVGDYVRLEKKGKSFFGLCPFHKEKTASFSVDPSRQMFYCFGCGKGGGVFQFIRDAENLDFIEAVKFLAERAKIQLPEGESEEEKQRALKKQEILKINLEAARFFFNQLGEDNNSKAKEYLLRRKVSDKIARKFGIGYAGEGWDQLYDHLRSKGFSDDVLENSGLILKKKSGGYYDRFRNRIIFPIFDLRGNVIGFGGRVLDDSMPKYMNSPETLLYNKRNNLYALNFAKNAKDKRIIVVEGYMDVVSLHQYGITNSVASLGTALTETQGRILKKYAEEIIISYDADSAGQAATMRGLDLLGDIGCNVKVLIIPEGKDPDEFIKNKGPDVFGRLVDKALSLVEYKIKILKSEMDTETTDGKIAFLNRVVDLMFKIDNSVEREMYIKKISGDYKISEQAVFSEIKRRTEPKSNLKPVVLSLDSKKKYNNKSIEDNDKSKLNYYEKILLCLLALENSLYKIVKTQFEPKNFEIEENRELAKVIYNRFEDKKSMVPAELLNMVDSDTASYFASLIQGECNFEDNIKAVEDILNNIRRQKLNKREKEILSLLSNSGQLSLKDREELHIELKSILLEKKNI